MYAHAIHSLTSNVTRTAREVSQDQTSKNARLLIRAGYISQAAAGVYTLMPLAIRVLARIEQIVREEMLSLGAQEFLAPALQARELWETTGRWESIDVLYQLRSRHGQEYGLAATAEEAIVAAFEKNIRSYRDLPAGLFQISTKFRDEPRARSGLLRGREFRMKDLYSFHLSEAERDLYYEEVCRAYMRIFARCGIGAGTLRTFASGGVFSKFSDEFQLLHEAGEDTVFVTEDGQTALNKEVADDADALRQLFGSTVPRLREHRAIEIGNTFKLGVRYTDAFGVSVQDSEGARRSVQMCSYGIGTTRVLASIAEVYGDDAGLVWPKALAPYDIHVVVLGGDSQTLEMARQVREVCAHERLSALIDERPEIRAGEKFADADLLGIPLRVVIGGRSSQEGSIEVKRRTEQEVSTVSLGQLTGFVAGS